MRHFLLSTVALAALTGATLAADLPSIKSPPPAPAPAAFTWTGFYLGANGGFGGDVESQFWGYNFGAGENFKFNSSGFLGGAQVGYNYQFANRVVLGVEADFDAADIQGQYKDNYAAPGFFANTQQGATIHSLGTVRGRLGYALLDRAMIYATGGLAYGQVNTFSNEQDFGGFAYNYLTGGSGVRAGWTAGLGIEYALTNHWTFKTEYLYADLGSSNAANAGGACFSNCGGGPVSVKSTVNLVRAGLNYKFGDGEDSGFLASAESPAPSLVSQTAFTWIGFYLGVNGGYGGDVESATYDYGFGAGENFKSNSSGFLGGVQVGYNYQFANRVVLGVEADFDAADIQGQYKDIYAAPDFFYNSQLGAAIHSLGTVRGRLGYALLDRAMIYATGGLAYGQVNSFANDQYLGGVDSFLTGGSGVRAGWTAGLGIEYALTDHWTFKTEYLYADLGTSNPTNVGGLCAFNCGGGSVSVKSTVNLVRAGLNYKFGDPEPVVAKY
jgi:outer membrane immunogenic protein